MLTSEEVELVKKQYQFDDSKAVEFILGQVKATFQIETTTQLKKIGSKDFCVVVDGDFLRIVSHENRLSEFY